MGTALVEAHAWELVQAWNKNSHFVERTFTQRTKTKLGLHFSKIYICMYIFIALHGIQFGAKSIGKVWLQSKFGLD